MSHDQQMFFIKTRQMKLFKILTSRVKSINKSVLNPARIIVLFFLCLGSFYSSAQTPEQITAEAKSRGIASRAAAINELAKNGITVNQAREMASLKGMDFDAFLDDYLASLSGGSTGVTQATSTSAGENPTTITIIEENSVVEPESTPVVTSSDPSYFGYSIFDNNPFGDKAYLVGNIDEGYLLAPGDELRINVFGDNNLQQVSKIDLNGNISFPGLGVFQAAGSSYATLKDRLKIFLGRFYSGLLSSPQRSFMDVSLTQIRPVKITILGQVNTPGPHLVNGLATVLNALYASGGVKTSGSLRDIKVYRGNKLLRSFDLYDFITQGKIDQDIRLANNDIIFVGPRLSSVTLSGAVKQSGIYELKPQENTSDLFRFSGGLPPGATLGAVNISRITPFEGRSQEQLFDRFLTTVDLTQNKSFALIDGDKVSVQGILDRERSIVTLQGSVNKPGSYSLQTYKDLKGLIQDAGMGLLENTYMNKVDLYRRDELGNLSFKTYNLQSVLEGDFNVALNDRDRVVVFSEAAVQGEKKISITGFVPRPNELFWAQDLNLFDVIFSATSFEELEYQSKVLTSRVDIRRFDPQSGQYRILTYSLDNLPELKTTALEPRDQVVLYTRGVSQDTELSVSVLGSVKSAGSKPLAVDMLVEDALLAAGGFSEFADKSRVEVFRRSNDALTGKYSDYTQYEVDLDYMLGKTRSPKNPFVLENYDIIIARTPKDAELTPTVSISGEVIYPGSLVLQNSKTTVEDLIRESGGLTEFGYLPGSYLVRQGKPLAADLKSKSNKVTLLPGDQMVIISEKEPVITTGNVKAPTTFKWLKNRRAKYYIRNSGGTGERPEDKFVVYPSGKTKSIGWFKNPRVMPGSQLVVTQRPEKVQKEGGAFIDKFIQVFSIATGALTTLILATRL